MKRYFPLLLLLLLGTVSRSQQTNNNANNANVRLANQYYINGEYEKAAILYDKLYTPKQPSEYYLSKYVDCLLALEAYDKAETSIQSHLAKYPESSTLYVTYGKLLERQGRQDEADAQYQQAIDHPRQTGSRSFSWPTYLWRKPIVTWQKRPTKRTEDSKDKADFSYYMAEMYRRKGDQPKMIHYYLESLMRSRPACNKPNRCSSASYMRTTWPGIGRASFMSACNPTRMLFSTTTCQLGFVQQKPMTGPCARKWP